MRFKNGKNEVTVQRLLENAAEAQRRYENFSQEQVDEVTSAVGWAVVAESNNRLLSEQAVADTGLGRVEDKMLKNRRKTLGLLRDLKCARSVGVIAEQPELGLVEIARPVGIVAAIVPSTNPVATPTNKTINALKCRNAVILAPSPKGENVCETLVTAMHRELDRVGAPRHLVQKLPTPVNKQDTLELLQQADLVVATGSRNNVRTAYTCGTPAVGVGAGNVVSIVDESANIEQAAGNILVSKTFDNATSCSSENNLIVVEDVYETLMAALCSRGAAVLSAREKQQLQDSLWQGGKLNGGLIAKSASVIAAMVGLSRLQNEQLRILLVEEDGFGPEHPFSGEKLSPILTVYKARDFDHARDIAKHIMDYQGKGHSLGIHTGDEDRPLLLGLEMPVCRIIVNQIHCYATGGSFDNGLPFSLSMGCGTWGENSISDNLNYRHFMNITRISRRITPDEPSLEDIFGRYWADHGISTA